MGSMSSFFVSCASRAGVVVEAGIGGVDADGRRGEFDATDRRCGWTRRHRL